MTAQKTLTQLILDQASQVSSGFSAALKRHLSLLPTTPRLSAASKEHIAKRVPPKTRSDYLSFDSAIALLALEIQDLALRISRYQFIERYREYFQPPDAEMRTAFVMHTHILRGSEIYTIMERCVAFIDFYYDVATDLSLNPTKTARELETRFKKSFERHLRERHRIVHAHERPSLISRVISVPPEQASTPEMAASLDSIVEALITITALAGKDTIEAGSSTAPLDKLNCIRLKAVDEECLEMWSILVDSITKLIDSSRLLVGTSDASKSDTA